MTGTRDSIPGTSRADRRHPGARLRTALIAVVVTAGGLVPAFGAASAASASPANPTTVRHAHVRPAVHPAGAPDLGPNVYIFTPDMPQSQIQATVDEIAAQQVGNQFGTQRYALLFE